MELSEGLMTERYAILWVAFMISAGLVIPFILEVIEWYRENRRK